MENSNNSFAEFYKYSQNEYIEKISNELKNKQLENYNLKFDKNIIVNPLNINSQIDPINLSTKNNQNWLISEEILAQNFSEINSKILQALEGGANAISLNIYEKWTLEQFEIVFKDVYVGFIYINFSFKNNKIETISFLEIFNNYLGKIGIDSKLISGSIETNNLVEITDFHSSFPLIRSKVFCESVEDDLVLQLSDLLLDAEYFLNNNFEKIAPNIIENSIFFEINLCENIYLNISKIRALKILWFTILESYNIKKTIFIKTKIIPTNNENENTAIIAATSQAMAAILGGVDLLEIQAFNHENSKKDTTFSTRIARNMQNILAIESQLNQVSDPLNGSYFIENLTKQITEKVWAAFKNKFQ